MSSKIITAEPTDQPTFAWEATQAAFGLGTPAEQMLGAFVGIILAYVSTVISLGATVGLVLFFGLLFAIGLARFIIEEFQERGS